MANMASMIVFFIQQMTGTVYIHESIYNPCDWWCSSKLTNEHNIFYLGEKSTFKTKKLIIFGGLCAGLFPGLEGTHPKAIITSWPSIQQSAFQPVSSLYDKGRECVGECKLLQ